eukprot:scaffold272_cov112-Isochrysis_galbana.AAC.6
MAPGPVLLPMPTAGGGWALRRAALDRHGPCGPGGAQRLGWSHIRESGGQAAQAAAVRPLRAAGQLSGAAGGGRVRARAGRDSGIDKPTRTCNL